MNARAGREARILLTNDDGIDSPGLLAAAEALSELGHVTVCAPSEQCTGSGRSMPPDSSGIIAVQQASVLDQERDVYAVGGTPAQVVQHGVLEIVERRPDLVVSGINYGENVGTSVTISGTIGAALEAASVAIPALAVSLETPVHQHLTHSDDVDFAAAAHFTTVFARRLLVRSLPQDVHVLKVDVPCDATPETSWQITKLSRQRYYRPIKPEPRPWGETFRIPYTQDTDFESYDPDSDAFVLRVKRAVSVTPLSLDLTSRILLSELQEILK